MPSKTKKYRGYRTHGRGKKAGRGAGLIGGHGKAGVHKHELMRTLKYDRDHWGRHGFKRPQKMVYAPITINVGEIEGKLDFLRDKGYAEELDGKMTVYLSRMGVDKVLGNGQVGQPMDVVVNQCSVQAKAKVEAAGGSVVAPE